ncbi:MAG: sugar transferase [Chlamydiales bacterium]|nr:sugar transferase [Chlamydiales bacterium]
MQNIIKRLFDVFFSLFIISVFSPLFIFIAAAIKLTSKGPIFYKSRRLKNHFQPFNCFKFRTMYIDAEKSLQQVLQSNLAAREEWSLFRKLKHDPRITPIGSLLRKTSLDELPQFFNVLKGDLSVVGPRPVSEEELLSYFGEKAKKILSIKPGITGIWQTSGRNKLTMQERIYLDERYIEIRSFFLDLKIIFKTIHQMIFPKGAC